MKKWLLIYFFVFFGASLAQNLPSGGLGLTLKQWESLRGKPTGQGVVGKMYGNFEVLDFGTGRIDHIEINLKNRIPEGDAINLLKSLRPKDAKFIKVYNPANRPETKVYLYSSKYIGGQFICMYNIYPTEFGVGRMIIAKGNNP